MRTTRPLDRILLLLAALVAAWHIVVGLEGGQLLPMISYTVAFGILLVAEVLLIILGLQALESPVVVILSTAIPLGLAVGLSAEVYPGEAGLAAVLAVLALPAVAVPRVAGWRRVGLATLIPIHALAGLWIVGLPAALVVQGYRGPAFLLVSLGGVLIGLGGLLLSFLKAGRPLLSEATIFKVLPGLLLLTTAAFVAGFEFG